MLNGAKMWITNAPIADVALVWAKLDGVIRGFLVERGAEGFATPKIEGKLSPARLGHRRDRAGRCLRRPRTRSCPRCAASKAPSPASTRPATASPGARWARPQFCLEASADYVASRSVFGRPLAARQLIQKKLADMMTEVALGLEGALALGRRIDRGDFVPEAISLMKRNNCGKALEIARAARDIHGGNGISGEYHVMRHAANLETVNTYEGAHDVHALILGRAITGENAF